jgi:hypothetical protein
VSPPLHCQQPEWRERNLCEAGPGNTRCHCLGTSLQCQLQTGYPMLLLGTRRGLTGVFRKALDLASIERSRMA